MKIGLLSDIHANYHALTSVMCAFKHARVDLTLCAGDLVGYGANPCSVIHAIRKSQIPVVSGNYDEAVAWNLPRASRKESSPRNEPLKRAALAWTKRYMSGDDRRYLQGLPHAMQFKLGGLKIHMLHAGPDYTDEWFSPDEPAQLDSLADDLAVDVIVLGHTHQQFTYNATMASGGPTLIVNPGAVGRALDGDVRAACAILDTDSRTVQQMRVDYDVASAVQDIRKSNMPPEIALLVENGARRIEELDVYA